jgi:hypothetical protein
MTSKCTILRPRSIARCLLDRDAFVYTESPSLKAGTIELGRTRCRQDADTTIQVGWTERRSSKFRQITTEKSALQLRPSWQSGTPEPAVASAFVGTYHGHAG